MDSHGFIPHGLKPHGLKPDAGFKPHGFNLMDSNLMDSNLTEILGEMAQPPHHRDISSILMACCLGSWINTLLTFWLTSLLASY